MSTAPAYLRIVQLCNLVKELALCRHAAEGEAVAERVTTLTRELEAEIQSEVVADEAAVPAEQAVAGAAVSEVSSALQSLKDMQARIAQAEADATAAKAAGN